MKTPPPSALLRLPTIAVLLILVLRSQVAAQDPQLALSARLDSLLASSSLRPFNGQVEISQDGKSIYSRRLGHGDMLRKTPFAAHPQFVIGSVSKQVTAVLVLRAYQNNLLSLDAPLSRYLPELSQPWADSVTIHHLLNHTSGFQGRDKPLAFRPGSKFAYSNQGYGLLGEVLAKVTGKPYEDLAVALFKRCGMKHSTTPSHLRTQHRPQGFSRRPDGSVAVDTTSSTGWPVPAALLISTPGDIVRWNECLHIHHKLLNDNLLQSMVTPSSVRPHPIFGEVGYGYGVQTTRNDSLYEISHGGYFPGFVSVNFYYPDSKISLVVMENLDWMDPGFKQSFSFEMEMRRILRESGLIPKKNDYPDDYR